MPLIQIAIDTLATNASRKYHGYKEAVVATFLEPVTLYRILDGEELARINDRGEITGGMFAVFGERAYGASWAAMPLAGMIRWGRNWQRRRLGRDLFIAKIDGLNKRFYHMNIEDVEFNPHGSSVQHALMNTDECDVGLGCSLRVPIYDAEFFKVLPDIGADRSTGEIKPMTPLAVSKYATKKIKPVMLLPLGGTHAYAGTILGYRVIVTKDHNDNLWVVRLVLGNELEHEERKFIMGGRSKKQVVDAAVEILFNGPPTSVVYLNKRPLNFEAVRVGQIYVEKRSRYSKVTVEKIGASYVLLKRLGGYPAAYSESFTLDARSFMRMFVRTL